MFFLYRVYHVVRLCLLLWGVCSCLGVPEPPSRQEAHKKGGDLVDLTGADGGRGGLVDRVDRAEAAGLSIHRSTPFPPPSGPPGALPGSELPLSPRLLDGGGVAPVSADNTAQGQQVGLDAEVANPGVQEPRLPVRHATPVPLPPLATRNPSSVLGIMGSSCSTGAECQTGICVVETSPGYCSRSCPPRCPSGYRCNKATGVCGRK